MRSIYRLLASVRPRAHAQLPIRSTVRPPSRLFFAHYLRTGSAAEALSRAASSVFGVLKLTAERNAREILLIEAQDEFVNPAHMFPAEPI